MGLTTMMKYLPLVVDKVLYGERRRDDLTRCAKMIELSTRQRKDGNAELRELLIAEGGVGAKTASEVGVEVVGSDTHPLAPPCREEGLLHQQLDGAVAKQPHADIGEVEVVVKQFVECLDRRFLQHAFQHGWVFARRNKYSVILGNLGIEPQAVAHHVDIGNGLQRLRGTNEYVAAHHHRMQVVGSHRHDAFIERHLQR